MNILLQINKKILLLIIILITSLFAIIVLHNTPQIPLKKEILGEATDFYKTSKEDLAAGIVNLVGQTIARIATSVAMAFKVSDIIVVGRAPTFTVLRKSLEEAAMLTNFTPHFPEKAEFAPALGALLIAEKQKDPVK